MNPYSFKKTEYANPGTGNFAFVPNSTLPLHSLIGAATQVQSQIRVAAPQQFFVMPSVPMDGYGGLVAGQLISQPLTEE